MIKHIFILGIISEECGTSLFPFLNNSPLQKIPKNPQQLQDAFRNVIESNMLIHGKVSCPYDTKQQVLHVYAV